MQNYLDLNHNSGVAKYEIGFDYITVEFKKASKSGENFYKYTYSKTGKDNVEHMKNLARQGSGLNSFINSNVKDLYESSW